MTLLADIIEINATQTDAAISVERSLDNQDLIRCFAPTRAAANVFRHLCLAVLPQATQEHRAINLWGNYGSGKSHLAVLLAQLLRDGSGGEAFAGLFQRLSNFGEAKLAQNLQNTFLAADDTDAKPYLLVSLYGSESSSLAAQLMEGLYDALERHPLFSHQAILPTTEYEVCVKRFDEIVSNTPELANADLPRHLAIDYATTKEMRVYLEQHRPEALAVFKEWHKEICYGAPFNPANEGGKNFIEAYKEAGKNLAEQHNFGGIVVLWDEFGFALEDLIGNPRRHSLEEIEVLQRFVETVCKPASLGHTLFIGLSHVSFREYAQRMNASEAVKKRLEALEEGRIKPLKIELSVSESEGYHLLGMQRAWTTQGKQLLVTANTEKQQLSDLCRQLPLFNNLDVQLVDVLNEVYPLHPITAAGLFALSAFAQANRTALTFFRDNATQNLQFLSRELSEQGLFKQELIRLPELVAYYLDKIKEKKAADWERYDRAMGKIPADLPLEQRQTKQAILAVCLLAELLGENFQTTEGFLAVALYDKAYSEALIMDLAWLKSVHLLWKDELTQQWTLSGDTGVDIEALIAEQEQNFRGRIPEKLLTDHPDMLEDLLPQVGEHELEPSACGIVRSYRVSLLTSSTLPKLNNPLISGQVFLMLANNPEDVELIKATIQQTAAATVYFWLPLAGIRAESVTIEGKPFRLSGLLCRYLALEVLLKQKTNSEELRRQLTAKWERTRQEALNLLRVLYGRDGLQSGKSQIFKVGAADAIDCNSWHEVRRYLAEEIQAAYPQEVPIRANNMNTLNDEKYTGSKIVLDMVERILNFDSNKDYQNDLLGEAVTSQQAALIDGVLGANDLFIQRPSGWDIKKLDETSGNMHAVLKHLHNTLLRKRESPFFVEKLRNELIAPPYGIPASNLAVFAAVAVRHEIPRLRWQNTRESSFAKNLTHAFDEDSKITIRLFEFSSKQFAMLYAVGRYFQLTKKIEQTQEEFASDCSYRLRDFVKGQAEAVKQSRQLQEKTQKLVKFFELVGKNPQDLAEFLIELLEVGRESEGNIASKSSQLLKELLADFSKVEDARRYEIEQSWQNFMPSNEVDKADLIARLSHELSSSIAKKVAGLINDADNVGANNLTLALLNKSFDQCSDSDIGQCKGQLSMLVDYHPPIPPPIPTIVPAPSAVHEPTPDTSDNLIQVLREKIDAAKLPNAMIQETLQQLLNHYKDA
jgi:energy-coupling factor transporter ATP-binding protein EcfA2